MNRPRTLVTALAVLMLIAPQLRAEGDEALPESMPAEPASESSTSRAASEKPPAAQPTESKLSFSNPSTWLSCDDGTDRSQGWLRHLASDEIASSVFGPHCDVGWHKPIFILPYSYSPDYESDKAETVFQVSAKLRPIGLPIYLAYSQRSFWSLYDASSSRPFRETVYNPEIFWRWYPSFEAGEFLWGADFGYEHESNGQDLPRSRSWDRLYISPFIERRGTAAQLKIWFRLPEDRKKDENDPRGDDNPDIERYYGYAELQVHRRIGDNRRVHVMLRGNPSAGRGAIQLQHDWRIGGGDLFWQAYLWHGYGESLMDYNDTVTRIGVGFSMSR